MDGFELNAYLKSKGIKTIVLTNSLKPNKRSIGKNVNYIPADRYQEFNDIYQHFHESDMNPMQMTDGVDPSIRQGLFNNVYSYHCEVSPTGSMILFQIGNNLGKIVLGTMPQNAMSGSKAFKHVRKLDTTHVLDRFESTTQEDADNEKSQIESPIIKNVCVWGVEYDHVSHIDLNGAYPSEIIKACPQMLPIFNSFKDKTGRNSFVGFCQSEYTKKHTRNNIMYAYAKLAKIAINNTNTRIINMCKTLKDQNFTVLGINTDGIWYRSNDGRRRLYHDKDEGKGFGKWKNDHIDCVFRADSNGTYYYIENGGFHPVMRGFYRQQFAKSRSLWNKADYEAALDGRLCLSWDDNIGWIIEEIE